jgi:CubicO group peptidase (beta-lactamase class C family)
MKPRQPLSIVAATVLAAWALAHSAAVAPAPDEPPIGATILAWSPQQRISGYRAIDQLMSTREIPAGDLPYPLIPDARDWSKFSYSYGGKRRSLDDYVRDTNVAGLIVVKNDRVLLERYALGNDEHSRWISFSVAKSVVSMLIGAAIKDGYFDSVQDRVVDYLPRLKGG